MGSAEERRKSRLKRKRRIRKKITGTAAKPRLSVFRSARHIYAQVIDDTSGKTMVAASSLDKAVTEHPSFESKVAKATFVGKLIAERALENGLKEVVFDRNGFLYHGRVKAVSDGAREGGLKF